MLRIKFHFILNILKIVSHFVKRQFDVKEECRSKTIPQTINNELWSYSHWGQSITRITSQKVNVDKWHERRGRRDAVGGLVRRLASLPSRCSSSPRWPTELKLHFRAALAIVKSQKRIFFFCFSRWMFLFCMNVIF